MEGGGGVTQTSCKCKSSVIFLNQLFHCLAVFFVFEFVNNHELLLYCMIYLFQNGI